jgi:hypothetical protein
VTTLLFVSTSTLYALTGVVRRPLGFHRRGDARIGLTAGNGKCQCGAR